MTDQQGNVNFWQGRKVLVTGAAGFIGSHLVETLMDRQAEVKAYIRYNSRNDSGLLSMLPMEKFSRLEVVAGDLRDISAVRDAMQGAQTVIHLGALIAIPYSYNHPVSVVESNVIGTLNVLMAARETGVERLVHTSTSEVYGTALRVPIDEAHPLQGQSPYAASKIGADKLAESFYCSYDLPVVTVRPFNTYGPRQSMRAVIPTIITQALTRDVIRLGNLKATRDLTYVSDTVEGFLKAAEAVDVEGQTFNLGVGKTISIGDLANEIIGIVGKEIEIVTDASRLRPEKSEVQRLLSDNRLAAEKLGWQPKIDLRSGLEKTVAWVSNHLSHYQGDTYQI